MLADTTGRVLTVTVVVAVEAGIKLTAFVTPLFHEYVKAPLPLRVAGEPAHTD